MNQPALKDLLKARGPKPFIGFVGKGSRITVSDNGSVVTIQQALSSQFAILALVGVFGPGLTALTYFKWDEVSAKPPFALIAISFAVVIGWSSFIKYLLIAIGRQRIEYRRADNSLVMHSWKGRIHRTLRSSELQSLAIHESFPRTNRVVTPNFTLSVQETNGSFLDLVSSDQQEVIQRIKTLLTQN